MSTTKRVVTWLAVMTGALLIAWCCVEGIVLPRLNYLRQSPEGIRASMKRQTPIGSKKSDVEALIEERGWSPGASFGDEKPNSIGAGIGAYEELLLVRVVVIVTWEFDRADRLEAIRVDKVAVNLP